ncbi:MAG: carbohydrate-binding domain-containing protein [Butyrivibrio sp.]|nr:carbohydrate-binding domain-containing protein [Butyrivibrio sp.]
MNEFINNGAVVEEVSRTGNIVSALGNMNNALRQQEMNANYGVGNSNVQQNTGSGFLSMLGSFFGQNQPSNNTPNTQAYENIQQPQMNTDQQSSDQNMPIENQTMEPGNQTTQPGNQTMQPGNQTMQPGNQTSILESADSPTEVVAGTMTNSAASLEADYDNATYITVTDDDSNVEIKSSGTYVVTGSSSDGNITVKKGTSGVVLVLDDLDLTSTTGATVSVNKEAEVKIIISGTVTLTDNENPDDENSTDEAIADAFDGAALKAKAGSQVYVTGDGTLTINGNAKNGIKGGDDSSIIFDGVTMNITAANDGVNSNYDVTLLSGNYTISAQDDAIHADHILTVGNTDGTGPAINITESNEGLEGTVVNIYGGDVQVTSSDDAVNAANGDGVYEGELDYSFNMMGGNLTINSQGDGIDSNGNINLLGGSATINSTFNGGEAGIDYDGQLYISDDFDLNNNSSVAGPDGMGGTPDDMNDQPGLPEQQFAPEPAMNDDNNQKMGGQQPGPDIPSMR